MRGELSPSGYPFLPSRLSSVGFEVSREDRDSYPWPSGSSKGFLGRWRDQFKAWTEELTVSGSRCPLTRTPGCGQLCREAAVAAAEFRNHPVDGASRLRRRGERPADSPTVPGTGFALPLIRYLSRRPRNRQRGVANSFQVPTGTPRLPEQSRPWPKKIPHADWGQHPNTKSSFEVTSALRQFVLHGQEGIAFECDCIFQQCAIASTEVVVGVRLDGCKCFAVTARFLGFLEASQPAVKHIIRPPGNWSRLCAGLQRSCWPRG